jgi:flagellar hook-length control protein FliK
LSQLNLKEIEIDTGTNAKQAAEVTKPFNLVFTAKTSAGEQLFRTSADRNRIRVSSSDGSSIRASSLSESRPVGVAEAVKTTAFELMSQHQFGQQASARQQLAMFAGKAEQSDVSNLKQNWSSSAENQQVLGSLMGYESAHQDNGKTAEARSDTQTARFVLPNDLGAQVKPNGQSVMLRIQPENLGTARLNLTMSGDKLKARITVDSAPAKAALESNLDRLVNDLKQANIQVDHIDISVSGESANNELWGRQPHWRHRMVSRMAKTDVLTSEEINVPVPPRSTTSAGYVGASGVNLLA